MILTLDTSGSRCGVALWAEDLVAYKEPPGALNHNEILIREIQALLWAHRLTGSELKAIAVSSGPGSFTGLRVGMAVAKGLCWSWNLPLITVPTLDAIANSAPPRVQYVLPLMPARAKEVYWRLYEFQGGTWKPRGDYSVSEIEALPQMTTEEVFLCGEGFEKHRETLKDIFGKRCLKLKSEESLAPVIVAAARLADQLYRQNQFTKSDSAEPLYCYSYPRRAPQSRD